MHENANITISINNTIDILNDIIRIIITTTLLHSILIILASNSITLSGSVYNLLINSPTPISSKDILGKSCIFLYSSV